MAHRRRHRCAHVARRGAAPLLAARLEWAARHLPLVAGRLRAGTGRPLSAERRRAAVSAVADVRRACQALAARRPGEPARDDGAVHYRSASGARAGEYPLPGGPGGDAATERCGSWDADRLLKAIGYWLWAIGLHHPQ